MYRIVVVTVAERKQLLVLDHLVYDEIDTESTNQCLKQSRVILFCIDQPVDADVDTECYR
jgi:hypothetical protein